MILLSMVIAETLIGAWSRWLAARQWAARGQVWGHEQQVAAVRLSHLAAWAGLGSSDERTLPWSVTAQ